MAAAWKEDTVLREWAALYLNHLSLTSLQLPSCLSSPLPSNLKVATARVFTPLFRDLIRESKIDRSAGGARTGEKLKQIRAWYTWRHPRFGLEMLSSRRVELKMLNDCETDRDSLQDKSGSVWGENVAVM